MTVRDLPSVDALAADQATSFDLPHPVVVEVCRSAIDKAREEILAGSPADPSEIAQSQLQLISDARARTVVNATGVLLNTNLGRAIVPAEAADAAHAASTSAGNVEVDLRTGRRSSRHTYLRGALGTLTGAEAGLAVNNNAGALLLSLAAVAGGGGKVAVSRGELIEIGGSFRLPELMRASGAELVEVGTTNRTRLRDFEAVADDVDAILKVHPSNYRIEGFHEDAVAGELATLAGERGVPFLFDVGSGLVDEQAPWLGDAPRAWLADEPGVKQSIDLGADLVMFSGDKLFGGPQAGIIVGKESWIDRVAAHPIARAVRLDGTRLASLAAVVDLYLEADVLSIPFWQMASAPVAEIDRRSEAVTVGIEGVTIADGASLPGAGSVPGATIPTRTIRVDGDPDAMWADLAACDPPVIATRRDGALWLDLRSVPPSQDGAVRSALETTLS